MFVGFALGDAAGEPESEGADEGAALGPAEGCGNGEAWSACAIWTGGPGAAALGGAVAGARSSGGSATLGPDSKLERGPLAAVIQRGFGDFAGSG